MGWSMGWSAIFVGLQCLVGPSVHAQSDSAVELSGVKFRNVTALSDLPADQMGKVMNIMSASLGVNCQYCHEGIDFARENVAHKDIGRKMIEMTLELNKQHFQGRSQVTCFTCHRGQAQPSPTVLFNPAAIVPNVTQPATQPSVDEILSKFLDALGGQANLAAIRSRHTVAVRREPDGRSEHEELWQTALGNHRMVTTYGTVAVTEEFDGKTASKKANEVAILLKPDEALQIEREPQIALGLNLKFIFQQLTFIRVEQIDGRRVFVLSAMGPSKIGERLYFDEQTSLLTRRTSTVPTVLGDFVYQVDYRDYKPFDRVLVPTLLQYSVPNINWSREVKSVEHNGL